MASRGDFDWDKVEEWVVKHSSGKTIRQISDESNVLPCFDNSRCSYDLLKSVSKERMFLQKRAEYQASKHGGILEDYRVAYNLVRKTIKEIARGDERVSANELTALGNLQIKYANEIMAMTPVERSEADSILTRDNVLSIIAEEMDFLPPQDLVDIVAPVTPGMEEGVDNSES